MSETKAASSVELQVHMTRELRREIRLLAISRDTSASAIIRRLISEELARAGVPIPA